VSFRWVDAAFEQEHLLRACDGYFGRLVDGYQEVAFDDRGDVMGEGVLRRLHREMLQRADPIYISPDVQTMWEAAVETFRPEPLHRTDLVAPSGFALMPRPMMVNDINHLGASFRAFSWLPVSAHESQRWDEDVPGQGVWASLYSFTDDGPPNTDDEVILDFERRRTDGTRWSLLHGSVMNFEVEDDWRARHPDGSDFNAEENRVVRDLWVMVQSAWRLMSQLVPTSQKVAPRQARRARQRKQLSEDVTVIRLRRYRPSGEEGEGEGIEYSHQWLVRGHWRNQWYPSIKMHRQIWIAPYVKGPEDKPLKISRRAFEWTQ
jgi:hypothetical protein